MSNPDPAPMIKYCREMLPSLLTEACEVEPELARQIGDDVLMRAEAFATLSAREQDVLIAPFVEEVFDHEPLDAPLHLRAKVTVVVRNGLFRTVERGARERAAHTTLQRCAARLASLPVDSELRVVIAAVRAVLGRWWPETPASAARVAAAVEQLRAASP